MPGGPWAILLDPLAGWFLLLIGVVGAAAMSYGLRYMMPERGHRPVGVAHCLVAVILAAMVVVVVAHAAVLFLLAWEVMAVTAYFLILFEGERAEVRRAGLIYLVLTHTGTLALVAMFLVWGRTGPDLTFQSLAVAAPALPWGRAWCSSSRWWASGRRPASSHSISGCPAHMRRHPRMSRRCCPA